MENINYKNLMGHVVYLKMLDQLKGVINILSHLWSRANDHGIIILNRYSRRSKCS